MKRYLISFLILIIAIGFVTEVKSQSLKEVNFVSSNEYLTNPGIGWQHFPGIGNQLLAETVEYPPRENISWKVLNPSENQYSWKMLDDLINGAKSRGNQIGLRIYTMRGETFGGHQVPDWVITKGAKIINGAPDYKNCVYQDEFGKFINQVISRYDGNSTIAFFDISGYGNFNEWSWQDGVTEFDDKWASDYTNNKATRDSFNTLDGKTRRRLADVFIGGSYTAHDCRNQNNQIVKTNYSYSGFQKTQLLMPYAGIRQSTQYTFTMRKDVGFRFDCLGSPTLDNIQQMVSKEVSAIWKVAPVVFEFCSYLGQDLYSKANTTLRFAHGSLVHDNIKGSLRNQTEVTNLMKFAGYRYHLKNVKYSSNMSSGNPFSMEMIWQNVGYAPYYKKMGQDFELRILITNLSNQVVQEIKLNEDISKWMPSETIGSTPVPEYKVITQTNISGLSSGRYRVYAGIFDKKSNKYINIGTTSTKFNSMLLVGELDYTSISASPTPTIQPTPTNMPTPTIIFTPTPILEVDSCGTLDINSDGRITLIDFVNFAKRYKKPCINSTRKTSCGGIDINKDGKVDITDLSELVKIYGKRTCSTSEFGIE